MTMVTLLLVTLYPYVGQARPINRNVSVSKIIGEIKYYRQTHI